MNDRRLPRPALAGTLIAAAAAVIAVTACEPRVTVEPPKEPITINVNVKIDHEVRVKVDKELDDLFDKKPELF
jgi:hypothetical protein